jgi:hypothetical protein
MTLEHCSKKRYLDIDPLLLEVSHVEDVFRKVRRWVSRAGISAKMGIS